MYLYYICCFSSFRFFFLVGVVSLSTNPNKNPHIYTHNNYTHTHTWLVCTPQAQGMTVSPAPSTLNHPYNHASYNPAAPFHLQQVILCCHFVCVLLNVAIRFK